MKTLSGVEFTVADCFDGRWAPVKFQPKNWDEIFLLLKKKQEEDPCNCECCGWLVQAKVVGKYYPKVTIDLYMDSNQHPTRLRAFIDLGWKACKLQRNEVEDLLFNEEFTTVL